MSSHLQKSLVLRRKRLLRQMQVALDADAKGPELQQLAAEMTTVNGLEAGLQRKLPAWTVSFGLLTLALFLLAISLSVRLSSIHISFDGKITSAKISASSMGFEKAIKIDARSLKTIGGTIDGVAVEGVEDAIAKASYITSLEVTPGALVEIIRLEPGANKCLSIQVGSNDIKLELLSGQIPDATEMSVLRVPVGGQVQFCVTGPIRFVASLLSQVTLARTIRLDPPPAVVASSIVAGSLTVSEISSKRKLVDTDRLSVKELSDATGFVDFDKDLRISFSGTSRDALILGRISMPLERGENLRPTLFALVHSSPALTSFFASLTALLGLLWSIWQKL